MKISDLLSTRIVLIVVFTLLVAEYSTSQVLWGVSTDNQGAVYKFDIKEKEFTLIHQFAKKSTAPEEYNISGERKESENEMAVSSGYSPAGVLLQSNDQYIYGITTKGGEHNSGVIFRVDTLSLNYEEIVSFGSKLEVKGNPVLIDTMIYIAANDYSISKGLIIGFNIHSNVADTAFKGENFWLNTTVSPGILNSILLPFSSIQRLSFPEKQIAIVCGTPLMSVYGMSSINESEDGTFTYSTMFDGPAEAGKIMRYDQETSSSVCLYTCIYYAGGNDIYHPMNSFVDDDHHLPVGCTAWNGQKPGKIYSFDMNQNISVDYGTVINKKFITKFQFRDSTGIMPGSDLVKSKHHSVYGSTSSGGKFGKGTLYSFNLGNSRFEKLYDMNEVSGAFPLFGHLLITNDYISDFQDTAAAVKIKAFPNPFYRNLYLDVPNEEGNNLYYSLFDQQGRQIIPEQKYDGVSSPLDFSKLSAGLYILKVKSTDTEYKIRILKNN